MISSTERVHENLRIEYVDVDADSDGDVDSDDGDTATSTDAESGASIARLVMEGSEQSLNAFSPSKVETMATAVESLAGEVDCLVVYGEPVFSVGADLHEIDQKPDEMRSARIDTIAAASNRFIRAVRSFPAPVVAAVTGMAAGGGLGFALAADLIYVHEDATFDTAFARIGLTPDNATPFFLVQTLGPYRTRELLFDPQPIDAETAVDLGLANDVYTGPESEFVDAVTDDLGRLAEGPTEVYARTKELVDSGFSANLDDHLEEERSVITRMGDSETFDEGLEAFFEKRSPNW
ncbi:enoyl-CoA hydratase/isomerase family protein [Natrarchaeobaculum aegyptiacum]|uniref:Enoyl-CoA hydratase n=1 Tax=Natrarchaeobaculum aegyptiacum TaxID=745377 RepID=A0A2Z2HX56_9EURY|nr:enoyl-CoA hydratase-related protein [Natrarchaeobaculum aegyptiacum]ARS89544.1 enoyl-CoA hydratase [Natrarchaeobaculum aegyptiacum]